MNFRARAGEAEMMLISFANKELKRPLLGSKAELHSEKNETAHLPCTEI